ncbi:MAG TPA: TolC family protein [Gemmatimonadales bacterium]|nr:TolC family protein [Gemmatimonadales bacterium]
MNNPVKFLALSLLAATPLAAQVTDSLTLQKAIELAQDQGGEAQAARAGLDASRYRSREFYSRQLPRLSVSGNVPAYNRSIIQVLQPDGSTSFQPQDQVASSLTATLSQPMPWTGGNFFVSSSLARLRVTGTESIETWSSTPVTFGLRQPLFRLNDLGWDRREQPVRNELSERLYRESREEIALRTVSLFFDVYAARLGMENADANVAINDTLYTLNKGRFEVGKIGENDLLQSELALLRARTSAQDARLAYERALSSLRIALHLAPGTPVNISRDPSVPVIEADTAVAVREALRNLSTVTDAELRQVQGDRAVKQASLNNGFGATVNASYGFNATGPEASYAYRNLQEARQFTLTVDVPLMQWGARGESIEAAKADRDRSVGLAQVALDQAAQNAHFAVLTLEQARQSLALSAKADTVANRRFDVALQRYVIGRITVDILYIAQSEKDAALAQFVSALRGYWLAYYGLRRATLYDFETGRPIR